MTIVSLDHLYDSYIFLTIGNILCIMAPNKIHEWNIWFLVYRITDLFDRYQG